MKGRAFRKTCGVLVIRALRGYWASRYVLPAAVHHKVGRSIEVEGETNAAIEDLRVRRRTYAVPFQDSSKRVGLTACQAALARRTVLPEEGYRVPKGSSKRR